MNNKEWLTRIMNHEDGLPVPFSFTFCPPALRQVNDHYGEFFEDAIDQPIRKGGPHTIKPLYAHPDKYGPEAPDEYGVIWTTQADDRGVPHGPPLTEPSLEGYTFPDPNAEHRFGRVADWCEAQEANYRMLWVGDLWERATFMRGMENILLDVALYPDFVQELLRGITDYILATQQTLFDTCEFEGICLSDDYGSQSGLLISPDDWRRLIKPFLAEIYGAAKDKGYSVFHHTCGHVTPIIGDMIDIGLDILNPIQPEAMDIAQLKKEFGADLTFSGGIPTQHLLTTGTPEEVRDEVKRLKDEMGKGGGFILEPGITIQGDVPLQNILAMIDEAKASQV